MLKIICSITLLSPTLLLMAGFFDSAIAQETQETQEIPVMVNPVPLTPGICGQIYGLSGRSVILPDGEFLRLVDYCTAVGTSIRAVSFEGEEFWQTFLTVANPEAQHYAEAAGRDEVVAYGATICPVLNSGTSLTELRQIQIEGGLPAAFDSAVNIAAIRTSCPQHRAQVGRL